MAKKETKITRSETRGKLTTELTNVLESMPINSIAKNKITCEWIAAIDRLSKDKITSKKWHDLKSEDLMKEYKEVEKYFKYLNIFSSEFYQVLWRLWDRMLYTFNPNVDWYKD